MLSRIIWTCLKQVQFLLLLPLDGVNAQVKKITSESETASPFMNISCVINGQFRLLRLHQKRRCENEFVRCRCCVVEFLCYKSSNFVEMMASFLLHWSLEFLLENWTYVKETCIAKIASQNSIFQLLNNVKTARERFYDL